MPSWVLVGHPNSVCPVFLTAAVLLSLQVTSWQFVDSPTGLYPQLWCPEGVTAGDTVVCNLCMPHAFTGQPALWLRSVLVYQPASDVRCQGGTHVGFLLLQEPRFLTTQALAPLLSPKQAIVVMYRSLQCVRAAVHDAR